MSKIKSNIRLIFNLPNILSLSRIALVIPIGITLSNNQNALAVGLILLAGVTDILDGYFARGRNDITEFGKLIDPIADKIAIALIVITLMYQERLPVWFVIVVLLRDILIILGGIIVKSKKGILLPSNYYGKAAVVIISLNLIAIVSNIDKDILIYFYFASVFASVVSFGIYINRGIRTILNNK